MPYVSRRTRVEVNSSAELSAACFQVSSQAQNHPDDSRYSSGRGLASISTRREYGLSPRQQRGGGDLHGATRGEKVSGGMEGPGLPTALLPELDRFHLFPVPMLLLLLMLCSYSTSHRW